MKRVILTTLLIVMPIFFIGCMGKTPYTKRHQLMLVSVEEENALGLQASNDILQKEKLSSDRVATQMVKRVGANIAKVADRNDFQWEFHLIDKDELNAFCLPGGKVFVYTGLLKVAKSEAQLATVMSHEIAHAIARHGAEKMSMQQATNIGKSLLTSALGITNSKWASTFDMAYGFGSSVGLVLPHSRKQESEADKIGLILMAKASYNPNDALNFWYNMQKLNQADGGFTFLRTHPTDSDRIESIKKLLPDIVKNYYKK